MKNLKSITHENCKESSSLILRTRNLRKPSRMLVTRNWKQQWLLLCLARKCKNSQKCGSRGKSNKIKSKLACILEADESTRLRVEEPLPNHHEDHIAGKRRQFAAALQFGSQISSNALKPMKIPEAKAVVDQVMEKFGENFGVEP